MFKIPLLIFAASTLVTNCVKTDNDYRTYWIAPNKTQCARVALTQPGNQWTAFPYNGATKTFATKTLAVVYIETSFCTSASK